MRRPTNGLLLTAMAAGATIALVPAPGRQTPESLLPPGFGQPPPRPRAAPATRAAPAPAPASPATAPAAAAPPPVDAPPSPDATGAAPEQPAVADAPPPEPLAEQDVPPPPEELPDAARRSLAMVGPTDTYGADAFGEADGRVLATLMRRLDAPVASRWAEIMLRRVLLTPTPAPRGAGQADWVADRAALLLRLGEADGARMLVQAVDVDRFSPRLRRVAIQSALATADPTGLCPLPDGQEKVGEQPIWPMIRAMCAGLTGDGATANATIGRGLPNDPIDHPLAEKVVASGAAGRRQVTIDWTAVDALTDWRFGLATALGVALPQALVDAAPAWFQAWLARAPMLAAADRIAPARVAAALGPVSSADLVDLYGRVMDEAGDADADSPSGRLRAAYVGDDDDARLSALHALWDAAANGQGGERDRYAASILTARAAARIAPSADQEDDVAPLAASMFAAGLDAPAERWTAIAQAANGADGDRAWSILAVGARRPAGNVAVDRIERLGGRGGEGDAHRAAMLAAALAGLGRLGDAEARPFMGGESETPGYGQALRRAVAGSERGTVALLVAAGMQSPSWAGVPAGDFRLMLAALRGVGMDGEARMIAAEAMTRL